MSGESVHEDGQGPQVRGDLGDVGRNRGSTAPVPGDNEINETELKSLFEHFIQTFRPVEPSAWDEDMFEATTQSPPFYLQKLLSQFETHSTDGQPNTFLIDLHHLKTGCPKLLKMAIRYPSDLIVFMDEVLADLVTREYVAYGVSGDALQNSRTAFKTSLFHHPHIRSMRELDPKDIQTLVALRGIVIRCSAVIPDMRVAVFRCTNRSVSHMTGKCDHEEAVHVANGEVQEPLQCIKCEGKYTFELYHSRCLFGNKQLLKIQETPEHIPEGETPHTVLAYAFDELVDVCKPGDFIELTGILRASGVRLNPRMRTLKSVYRIFIDINNIFKDHLNRYLVAESELSGPGADAQMDDPAQQQQPQPSRHVCTPELQAKMKALGNDPNIHEKLIRSLAPNIWEADDVKKGLLCQLFGGTPKTIGGRASRSDIHILLCGDPSTAKSQLLKYAHGIAPRGVYTCGRGSSAVGLTASVTRDPETKEFVLESGAIILSDRGICCIDEFDKMDETARTILHEVMEQQTVSIAKAGIVCSLNARTAILASANPIGSRYDTRRSVVDNINLPASLMSRFDLIYLMLDCASEHIDRALAQHLCKLYSVDGYSQTEAPPLDRATLAHYLSYAREFCKPSIGAEAKKLLVEAYLDFRKKGADAEGRSLSATPRQLESLIRMSESLAKMELNDIVEPRHVEEAIRLMQVATYAALIDPMTGRLDFDQLNAGISGGSRVRRELLENLLFSCLSGAPGGADRGQLLEKISEQLKKNNEYPLDPSGRELNLLLKELEDFGKIGRLHGGKIVSQVAT